LKTNNLSSMSGRKQPIQRKKNKKIYKKRAGRNGRGLDSTISNNLKVPSPFPFSKLSSLSCNSGPIVMQNAAANFVVFEICINDPYAGFATLPAPNCSFYAALQAAYNRSRVKRFHVSFGLTNNEPAIPTSFGLFFSDVQPSITVTTRQLAIDACEKTPGSGMRQVGITTGASNYRSPSYAISCSKLVERAVYNGDNDYSATTGNSPVQKVWMGFVIVLGNAGLIANGAIVEFHAQFDTLFFSLNN